MAQIIVTTDWGDEMYRLEVDEVPRNPKCDVPMWEAVRRALDKERGLSR